MRLKGHRTFDYIHKNSAKFYGKLMSLKIAKPNEHIFLSHKNTVNSENLKIAITISKKVSKKAVERNRLRRILQENFKKNLCNKINHKSYWLIVNLKARDSYNNERELLKEFQNLIFKSGLFR